LVVDGDQIRRIIVIILIFFIDTVALKILPTPLLYKYLVAKAKVLVQCPDVLVAIGPIYNPDHFEALRVQDAMSIRFKVSFIDPEKTELTIRE
jgi:hypothetical protein